MYTQTELETIHDIKILAAQVDKLEREPMIKVDQCDYWTARDRTINQQMPKAYKMVGRNKDETKHALLCRITAIVERVKKLAPDQIDLLAQLWVVYANITVNHRDDDHYSQTVAMV